ncbi:roundabout homolog 3-like [Lineus longissimus]|uniref:roundabout homolog 3-like n=1 Tax=Lineus longissimus TaxID=88925 RepID=UPI002B4DA0B2
MISSPCSVLLLAALAVATVGDKPVIIEEPASILVTEDDEAVFKCRVHADSAFPSDITWRRENGPLPHRAKQNGDRYLVINPVKLRDAGSYVCVANNSVGTSEARGMLTVHSKPSFSHSPKNKNVLEGKNVKLKCSVQGNPDPSLFWNKRQGQLLLFPDQVQSRFSVDVWGTLKIKKIRKEDAGEYVCNALSTAGTAEAVARIRVIQRNLSRSCTDYKGKNYYEGDRFSPEKEDPCYKCRCINSSPKNCTVIHCETPDCPVWESVRKECCKFRCIDGPTYTTEELNANIRWTAKPTKIAIPREDISGGSRYSDSKMWTLLSILCVLRLL